MPSHPPPADAAGEPGPLRVLVLQGGGALGAYQAGIYEALEGALMRPDWVSGVSIGAINAALIAGSEPGERVAKLRAFWTEVTSGFTPAPPLPGDDPRTWFNAFSAGAALFGVPSFFQPRLPGPWFCPPGTPEALSWYDTAPLKATLERMVDFDRINAGYTRLTVGAVDVQTGNGEVFDSARQRIGPEHVMASGALPPGLPPVRVGEQWYWDGGVVSNTPLQFVLDAEDRRDLLIFQVDLFNARGPMPRTLMEADEREKDIRYSSRTRLNTDATMRIHKAKTQLTRLLDSLPPGVGDPVVVADLREAARENAVTVVQLIYRKRPYEGGSKDFEFSRQTMIEHWAAGLADGAACAALRERFEATGPEGGVHVFDPGLADPERAEPKP